MTGYKKLNDRWPRNLQGFQQEAKHSQPYILPHIRLCKTLISLLL